MAARLVIGLVMEQMRKMASVRMGLEFSRSAMPCALNHATFPCRMTSVTAPAIRLLSMLCWTSLPTRSRRSDERPTDSGLAVGRSWAKASVAKSRVVARMHAKGRKGRGVVRMSSFLQETLNDAQLRYRNTSGLLNHGQQARGLGPKAPMACGDVAGRCRCTTQLVRG